MVSNYRQFGGGDGTLGVRYDDRPRIMWPGSRAGRNTTFVVDLNPVLRPFESEFYQTSRGRPVRERNELEEAVFEIRAVAKVEITTLEAQGWKINLKPKDDDETDEENDEVIRHVRIERVTNPSDPEQYVDVEVIYAITFIDKYGFQRTYNLES